MAGPTEELTKIVHTSSFQAVAICLRNGSAESAFPKRISGDNKLS